MPDSYSSDRSQADRSLLEQIKIVHENLKYLIGSKGKGRQTDDARRLYEKLTKGHVAEEWERGNIEEMYEIVISAKYRLPKAERHHDRRTKSLRY
jgi:hypothetical protein